MAVARTIPARRVRAFTIVEVVVVVAVIAVALAFIVPAFARITESATYASAVNRVSAALAQARAEAMRGERTGVVVLFDQETLRTTLVIVRDTRRVGGRNDDVGLANGVPIFAPLAGSAPIRLPEGVGVFGLLLDDPDQSLSSPARPQWWYTEEWGRRDTSTGRDDWFWIFPRNDARLFIDDERWPDLASQDALYAEGGDWHEAAPFSNTFMVLFDERGRLAEMPSAYVDFPLPTDLSSITVNQFPENPMGLKRVDVFDPGEWETEQTFGSQMVYTPSRETWVASVGMLAVVDMRRLADEAGIESPWLVRPDPGEVSRLDGDPTAPLVLSGSDRKAAFLDTQFRQDTASPSRTPRSFIHRISRWIDANAEVIAFNRSTGEALRRVSQ